MSVSDMFDYFALSVATSLEEVDALQHLRWSVYCDELGYEHPKNCPGQREGDEYDEMSVHLYITHRESGAIAGCVRVIAAESLPEGIALPLEVAYQLSLEQPDLAGIPRQNLFEISRLAIATTFRRRRSDDALSQEYGLLSDVAQARTNFSYLAVLLYSAVIALGESYGFAHACAMMQPRLVRLLSRSGLLFRQLAPLIEHHGQRAAYFSSLSDATTGMNGDMRQLVGRITRQLGSQQMRSGLVL
ncbi:PEP-CTERM/exosortase system-associated acyltransferase [Acidihalobacter yilgarnensis]|uniref:PEP-CTERM/exosortase system-associated acyltransferase n=1 Tax=Acidihalobacter yilgarnensis TaxID=2819280 RepID=UPI0018D33D10|nr:PEP-CTERM/exosortase system-associated acyltransferase [Acidihalobacter yilgarnensis]